MALAGLVIRLSPSPGGISYARCHYLLGSMRRSPVVPTMNGREEPPQDEHEYAEHNCHAKADGGHLYH
jgi:hypothetical protein